MKEAESFLFNKMSRIFHVFYWYSPRTNPNGSTSYQYFKTRWPGSGSEVQVYPRIKLLRHWIQVPSVNPWSVHCVPQGINVMFLTQGPVPPLHQTFFWLQWSMDEQEHFGWRNTQQSCDKKRRLSLNSTSGICLRASNVQPFNSPLASSRLGQFMNHS